MYYTASRCLCVHLSEVVLQQINAYFVGEEKCPLNCSIGCEDPSGGKREKQFQIYYKNISYCLKCLHIFAATVYILWTPNIYITITGLTRRLYLAYTLWKFESTFSFKPRFCPPSLYQIKHWCVFGICIFSPMNILPYKTVKTAGFRSIYMFLVGFLKDMLKPMI